MNDFYDELTYETNPFPETHPNNLAVLGRLFGLASADPAHCRVLELGSATGGNLIPMAWQCPGSEFVGVELSAAQVAIGQQVVDAAGLRNISLQVGNILELEADRLGRFDYIIVHGVYSWVPPAVRDKILQLTRDCLNPQGLAYISYNVLPGWRMRGSLRDVLLYATRDASGASEKLQAARAALLRLQAAMQGSMQHSGNYVLNEIGYLLEAHPSYLLHEYLAAYNQPFLFSEFLHDVGAAGLQYVCETDLHTLFDSALPAPAQTALAEMTDPLEQEQWMDFVRMRTFRQSVLCRADTALEREIDVDVFGQMAFTANLRVQGDADLGSTEPCQFLRTDGVSLTVSHPLTKAALLHLHITPPQPLGFAEVYDAAAAQVRAVGADALANEANALLYELFNLYSYRAVLAHIHASGSVPDSNPAYPEASRLARVQAAVGWHGIATALHLKLDVDDFARRLLVLLDGSRTVGEVVGQLASGQNHEVVAENVQRLLAVFRRHGVVG